MEKRSTRRPCPRLVCKRAKAVRRNLPQGEIKARLEVVGRKRQYKEERKVAPSRSRLASEGIIMRISTRPSALLAVTSVFLCGCTGIINRAINSYENEIDISTATGNDNVAVIRGSAGAILLASWDCWISHPVETKKLIVDPGFLSINFSCDVTGDRVRSTGFYLEFLAGQSKQINS